MTFIERIKAIPSFIKAYVRSTTMPDSVGKYISENPELLIIILDPATDRLVMSYKNKVVINKILTTDGKKVHLVKKLLRAGSFKSKIDIFIKQLADSLEVEPTEHSSFFHWVDGALYNIAKSLRK